METRPEAVYDYRDEHGEVLYRVLRYRPKRFEIRDAAGRLLSRFPERTVLYRLPELLAAAPEAIVAVAEGEKDADRLAELGYISTTNPGGCRLGWKPQYTAYLRHRRVVILADHDRPGARHAERIERALLGVAREVAILKLPRLPRAGDVSDWLDYCRGTPEELASRIDAALRRGLTSPPQPRGGHAKRHQVFATPTLSPSQRLLLLAIQHYEGVPQSLTAAELALATGLHRVTVQRLIGALLSRGILLRHDGRLLIEWKRLG